MISLRFRAGAVNRELIYKKFYLPSKLILLESQRIADGSFILNDDYTTVKPLMIFNYKQTNIDFFYLLIMRHTEQRRCGNRF